ncbi:MAG: ATP-binding protein [Thermodesulfovibrionales bacterium]
MKALRALNKRTSIKTKGILYVMLLIVAIYVSVSIVVLSSSRRNLNIQRQQFHKSVAEKLAITASDAIISEDYGFLMEQIRQLKSSGQVKAIKIIDKQGIIISSDALEKIGRFDDALLKKLEDAGSGTFRNEGENRMFIPIGISGDILGGLEIDFDLDAEDAALNKEFKKTIIQLMYLSLIIFAVGIGGSFIVSMIMTRPITSLSKEIEAFEKEIGLRHIKLHDPSDRDETVQLRRAFYNMIEDLKRYLSEFRRMSEEREMLTCMATVGEMSAQIAHELRNSLHSIRGAISGIERSDDMAEMQEYIAVIKDETREMTMMADEFFRFAKMPSPAFMHCDVGDIINRVIDLLEPDLEESNVKVIKKNEDMIPEIMGDPTLLKQVFINLFMNSIQAMKRDGTITVQYKVSDEWLEIYVKDTGPGIPGEIARKIFQPFFTTRADGTGLGLATVYKIILAHHGDIKLLPSERGAHFVIRLLAGGRHIADTGGLKLESLEGVTGTKK